jgi:hypothetical protein
MLKLADMALRVLTSRRQVRTVLIEVPAQSIIFAISTASATKRCCRTAVTIYGHGNIADAVEATRADAFNFSAEAA